MGICFTHLSMASHHLGQRKAPSCARKRDVNDRGNDLWAASGGRQDMCTVVGHVRKAFPQMCKASGQVCTAFPQVSTLII